MITDLNHIIIGVRDLEFAVAQFTRLGFSIGAEGTQASIGTRFANVQIGHAYIQLIEAYDPLLCMKTLANADVILHLLDMHDSAIVGFALTTTDIAEIYTRLSGTELASVAPYTIQSKQADNRIINVQMFAPGGLPYRRPWPLFYQWPESYHKTTNVTAPANGITDITHIIVGVHDLDAIMHLYQHYFGLQLNSLQDIHAFAGRYAKFYLGGTTIDLVTPLGEGILQRELAEVGEGICMIVLAVDDIAQAWDFFAEQQVKLFPNVLGPDTALIDSQETLGVRLVLAQKGDLQI